MITEKID